MTKSITKLELEQSVLRLTSLLASANTEIATLKAQILSISSCASAVNTMHTPRTTYMRPQWQHARVVAMTKAKATAIATHAVVLV